MRFFNIFIYLFFFNLKKKRGPERGPKRGPKGGSRREGPRFVYTQLKEKKSCIISTFIEMPWQHEPRASPTTMMGNESRSPLPRKRIVSAPPGSPSTEKRSSDNPPDKPPPPGSKKRPLSHRKKSQPVQFRKGRDATVTVHLVLTRSIKVDVAASTQDLVRAAASTFKLSKDLLALW